MRGFVVFLGLLLMLGGGAVAGVQYAPVDLATIPQLDQLPGSREFLTSQMALYAGGGAAAFGFLLIIIAVATGGKKAVRAVVKPPSMARETIRPPVRPAPAPVAPTPAAPAPAAAAPAAEPKPAPAPIAAQPIAAAPAPKPAAPATAEPAQSALPPMPNPPTPAAVQPAPVVAAEPAVAPMEPPPAPKPAAPMVAQPAPAPSPAAAAAMNGATPAQEPSKPKPQASAAPPAGSAALDPSMINRKRVQDLVTLNDAIKAYQAKHGAFPKADGLAGANERGAGWIPGLAPEFVPQLPRDPMQGPATQYVYVSDGTNYKLLAQGVSLVGSRNVEVLGIKIDPTRNPTAQNAAFGFWTPGFASV